MIELILDAGHGGRDSGCLYGTLKEKDVVLSVAKRVKQILENDYEGVKVHLTRETDKYLSLDERCQIANVLNVNLFVSLHINAGGGEGYETYIHPSAVGSTYAKRLQQAFHENQYSFTKDRGRKSSNFAVLRGTQMLAILVEMGFIDNASDRVKIQNIEQLAKDVVGGIVGYYGFKKVVKKYRVIAGDFTIKENADVVFNLLTSRGINVKMEEVK